MAMSVSSMQRSRGNANYHNKGFQRVLEDHISISVNDFVLNVTPLDARQLGKYAGDFYGLLIELGITEELHWFTMRINGLHSPADFIGEWMFIKIVQPNKVREVLDKYLSSNAQL